MNFENNVLQIPVEEIIPNRFQPRLTFDDGALNELAASIKEHGVIQPLVLRKNGEKYEIVAGERRYKASIIAGLASVPAVISNIDDHKSAEVAIVENVQRKDLSAIEEAKSYKALLDEGYMSQEQLAKKMGLSQSSVANKLRLLNLASEVQDAILNNKISERHARSLLQVKDKEEQVKWLNRIIDERLTVRKLDEELLKENNIDNNSSLEIEPQIVQQNIPVEPQVVQQNIIEPVIENNNEEFVFPVFDDFYNPNSIDSLDVIPEDTTPKSSSELLISREIDDLKSTLNMLGFNVNISSSKDNNIYKYNLEIKED